MNLFLAQAKIETVHSPGDDGMTGPFFEHVTRIVEAEDAIKAEMKFRHAFERNEPYRIRVSCTHVHVYEMIR